MRVFISEYSIQVFDNQTCFEALGWIFLYPRFTLLSSHPFFSLFRFNMWVWDGESLFHLCPVPFSKSSAQPNSLPELRQIKYLVTWKPQFCLPYSIRLFYAGIIQSAVYQTWTLNYFKMFKNMFQRT